MSLRNLLTYIIIKIMIAKGKHDLHKAHKNPVNARSKNEKLLLKILKTNSSCEYGKKYGFKDIKTVEDFRKKVPITTFNDYEGYIRRMIDNNESNLITSQRIIGYAQSSGSVGSRKFVPLTQSQINVYTRYTVTKMLAIADKYHRKKFGKGIKPGRGFFTPPAFDQYLPNGLPCSNSADVAARQLGFIFPYILVTPFNKLFNVSEADSKYMNFRLGLEDRNLSYIFAIFFMNFTDLFRYLEINWRQIVDDIEKGVISELGHASKETEEKLKKKLKPNPKRAAELRAEFEKGFDKTILKRIWPNLSVMYGIGSASFLPFVKIARNYTEGIPYDFSIYGASEGLFAIADRVDELNQLLLVDSCYYEFIPIDDETKILSLDELEKEKDYEIIITNQCGLYRYKCGDVIRVKDYLNDCPYLQFSYRKGQLLNLTGEKTTEEHMAAVVNEVEKMSGTNIKEWCVYTDYTAHPYHYVLLVETENDTDLSSYGERANEALKKINPRFEVFFEAQELGTMQIKNIRSGSQDEWKKKQIESGTSPAQYKPVRILDNSKKEKFFMSKIIN